VWEDLDSGEEEEEERPRRHRDEEEDEDRPRRGSRDKRRNRRQGRRSDSDFDFDTDDHDSDDYLPPKRRAAQSSSGLGISSFVIACVVGGLDVVLGLMVVLNVAGSKGQSEVGDRILGGATALVCLNCMSIPLCLAGVGLAIAALTAHKDRRHHLTYIGLFVNSGIILAVLGLYVYGSMHK
jgi:hypothetical protein